MASRIVLFISLSLFLICCGKPDFPGIGYTIENETEDKEYNILEISGSAGGKSYYARLKPGKKLNIATPSKADLTFRRRYKDYSRVYQVSCPGGLTSRIKIRLIDVHVNRIAGGCKSVNAYKE